MNTTENFVSTPQVARTTSSNRSNFHRNRRNGKLFHCGNVPTPADIQLCDTPEQAAAYWNLHITQHPYFNPENECLVVLILNTRRKIKGHYFVSVGTMDTILCSSEGSVQVGNHGKRNAIVIMHNHPSGESTPSEADIKVTRDLLRAGQLLKIDLVDHVVIGNGNHTSLRALGHLAY